MSKNFTHRNHHVPQKYQLGFADANERVHLYDRKRDKYIYGRPKNIGFENDFYTTVTHSGEPSDAVEKLLALVEGKTWPLLSKLVNGIELSGTERSTVAFFVALMRTRTTAFDTFSRSATDAIAKLSLQLLNPDEKTIQRRHEEMTGQKMSEEKAAKVFQAIQNPNFHVVPPRQNVIKMMLDFAAEIERGLVALEWEVYFAPADCKFITCDNPLITVPPPNLDIEIEGFGPLSPGVLNLMPIDSRTALFMKRGTRRQITFKRASRDLIREVNIMIVSASDRLIIACDEPQLRKLVAKCRPSEWVNSIEVTAVSPAWLADRLKKHEPKL